MNRILIAALATGAFVAAATPASAQRWGGGNYGGGSYSATDRNGDGWDDRDRNRDGRISERERRYGYRR